MQALIDGVVGAIEFRVLGPVEVLADGDVLRVDSPKQRSLLALLLIHVGQVVSTDRIIDAIWGDEPPEGGAKTLQYHVSKLRDSLGPHRRVIATRSPGYVLDVGPQSVDVERFEHLVQAARAQLPANPRGASAMLTEALSLWRGPAFSDFQYEEFVQAEARRLEESRLAALEERIRADLAVGRGHDVIGELEALVETHPLRERLRALLMVALYRNGRQADALHVYDELRKRLVVQLGLDPSPQLQALEQRILEQDAALDSGDPFGETTAPGRSTSRNPYKGLRPFVEADAADFHGRAGLVARMLERLSGSGIEGRFLVLTGPSGSGKSSVVRAGLIPALRQGSIAGSETWQIVEMYPGRDPLTHFDQALAGVDGEALLLIDQFEELYVLNDEATQTQLLDRIVDVVTGASGIRVVVTLRADFLDRPLTHPDLARLVEAGLLLVTPLHDDEVRAAVAEPAAAASVRVEPDLVAQIISDVQSRAAALPLLQYALTDLFEHRRTNELTLDAYRAAGGISGALAQRADQVYGELNPGEREAARQLFLRLVTVTPEAEHLRRRVPRSELAGLPIDQTALTQSLDRFGQHRLTTFDRDDTTGEATVEVAHEALLREWPRLWDWVEINRQDIRTHRRLAAAVTEWIETDRDPAFLPTGNRLALLQTFAAETTLALTSTEQTYIDAAAARAEQQRRQQSRRRRTVTSALATAALVAALFAIIANTQRNRADDEAATAEQQAAAAQEQRDIAQRNAATADEQTAIAKTQTDHAQEQQALAEQQVRIVKARELTGAARDGLETDPELSILLALEAIDVARAANEPPLPEAIGSLHEALLTARWSTTMPVAGEVVWSPEGTKLLGRKPGALWTTAIVIDAKTGETVYELDGMVDAGNPAWSPDGRFIATTDWEGPTVLWNAVTGERLPPLAEEMTDQHYPVFSADGTLLAARTLEDGSVTVVDTATNDVVARVEYPSPTPGNGIDLSPDGSLLAVAARDQDGDWTRDHIDLFTVPGGEPAGTLGPHISIKQLFFSPDGRLLFGKSDHDLESRIWDVATGEEMLVLDAGLGWPEWSLDGSTIAVAGWAGVAIIDAVTGDLLRELNGGPLSWRAFSPDGNTLATADLTGTRLWDLARLTGEIASFHTSEYWYDWDWLPDGTRLIATDVDADNDRVSVFDISTGRRHASHEQEGRYGFSFVKVSPDGRLAATFAPTGHGPIILDSATMETVAVSAPAKQSEDPDSPTGDPILAPKVLAFSPDSSTVAVFSYRDGQIHLYHAATAVEIGQIPYATQWATYLPAGRHLAFFDADSASPGGVLWDLEAGTEAARIPFPESSDGSGIALSADGSLLAIAERQNGFVGVWDVNELLAGAASEEAMEWRREIPGGVEGPAFSADNRMLYVSGATHIGLDVATGAEIMRIDNDGGVASPSPDGRYLALDGFGGLHIITTDLDELIAIARDRVSRDLTDGECQTYLHLEACPER